MCENLPFCACGCGERVSKNGNKFIHGHNIMGRYNPMNNPDVRIKTSKTIKKLWEDEEYREKQRVGQQKRWENPVEHDKASKAAIKRYKETSMSDDQRKRLSIIQTEKWLDLEYREKQTELIKISLNNSEYREKRSRITRELWNDEDFREKQSNGLREYWKDDRSHDRLSKVITELWKDEEYRDKMSGENAHKWKGGISFEPYCEKFNEKKKKEVRDYYDNRDYLTGIHRDICNKTKAGKIRELTVHHVDYNKSQGCEDYRWLLVPVSTRHNVMFNYNRLFWKKLIIYALEYDREYYK